MHCNKCQKKINEDARFCKHCGQKVALKEPCSYKLDSSIDISSKPSSKNRIDSSYKPILKAKPFY